LTRFPSKQTPRRYPRESRLRDCHKFNRARNPEAARKLVPLSYVTIPLKKTNISRFAMKKSEKNWANHGIFALLKKNAQTQKQQPARRPLKIHNQR
jgi:hypothetical protein